jgi:Protein of unknown function (DUF2854)
VASHYLSHALPLAFRYGDEQHLDEALTRIFYIGRQGGLAKRQCPRLAGLREELVEGGKYALVLEFQNRNGMTDEAWKEREGKFASFFGPGITAEVRAPSPVAWGKFALLFWLGITVEVRARSAVAAAGPRSGAA